MKKTVWDLFTSTGNTGYYRLYKQLDTTEKNGTDDKNDNPEGN